MILANKQQLSSSRARCVPCVASVGKVRNEMSDVKARPTPPVRTTLARLFSSPFEIFFPADYSRKATRPEVRRVRSARELACAMRTRPGSGR